MCEYYVSICYDPECFEKADGYNKYQSRHGKKMTLWRGYTEPCEHIKATDPDWEDYVEDLG